MPWGGVAMDEVAVFVLKNISDFGAEMITLVSSKIEIFFNGLKKRTHKDSL